MGYRKIDIDSWERKDKFAYFTTEERCEILLTCDVDVTDLHSMCREKGLNFYTALICVVSRVVNGDCHFRMGLDAEGDPVVYDEVCPCYTDFIPELEDFTTMITEYSPDMKEFYRGITRDRQAHKGKPCAAPENMVDNMFCISAVPWVHYKSLSLHYYNEWAGLAPIIYWGKYDETDGRLQLPVTLQVRHAVCDGYHAAKFFMDIEKMMPAVIAELSEME